MLPPLLSLSYCVWHLARRKQMSTSQVEWIGLVATLNLILSALVLHRLGGAFFDLVPQIPFGILNWLRSLMNYPVTGPDSELAV